MTERPEDLMEHGPVTLRRYREDDLDALVQAVSESEDHLRPWLPWVAGHSWASEAEFLAGPRGTGSPVRRTTTR